MAGEMTNNVSTRNNRGIQGLGFASGVYLSLDCMSTFNSSPWTLSHFGSDQGEVDEAMRFVRLAIMRSTALAMLTSWLMGSITPLLGSAVANADLYYVYHKAGQEAMGG